jgi:hypothetical protein
MGHSDPRGVKRGMRAIARAIVVLVCAAGATGARAEIVDRVLATVGSQVITLSDLRAAQTFGVMPAGAEARTPAELLNALVDHALMFGEVQRFVAPEPDRTLVDRRMAQIRAAFSGAGAYDQALARTAMTEDRLRSLVAAILQVDAYVEQRFGAPGPPSADEVQRYYADHPSEFTRGGSLLPFDEVRAQAQKRVAAVRQRTMVTQWLDRLRRGTHVEIETAALAGLK